MTGTHNMVPPDRDLVNRTLRYDPKTGRLYWRERRGGKAESGVVAGCVRPDGYRTISVGNKPYRAHRLVWLIGNSAWPHELDHINGDRDDNRLENLRECTRSQNLANAAGKKRPGRTSTFKGVYFSKAANKWVARIGANHKSTHLGVFENEVTAHEAYCAAARDLHGEFARFA